MDVWLEVLRIHTGVVVILYTVRQHVIDYACGYHKNQWWKRWNFMPPESNNPDLVPGGERLFVDWLLLWNWSCIHSQDRKYGNVICIHCSISYISLWSECGYFTSFDICLESIKKQVLFILWYAPSHHSIVFRSPTRTLFLFSNFGFFRIHI